MTPHKPLAQWSEAEKRAAVREAFQAAQGSRATLPTETNRSDTLPAQGR